MSLRLCCIIAVATFLLCCSAANAHELPPRQEPQPRQAQQVAPRKFYLGVGVEKYHHDSLLKPTPLKYCVKDVTALAEVLKPHGYEVSLLTDEAGAIDPKRLPTKKIIEDEVKRILENAKPGDTVIMAFAGHGIDASSPPPPAGVAAFFSCIEGQRAYETEKLGHGVFFYHVIEGLTGKAKNNEYEVTINSLADFVGKRVPRSVRQLLPGRIQHPNLRYEQIGASLSLAKFPAPPSAERLGEALAPLAQKIRQRLSKDGVEEVQLGLFSPEERDPAMAAYGRRIAEALRLEFESDGIQMDRSAAVRVAGSFRFNTNKGEILIEVEVTDAQGNPMEQFTAEPIEAATNGDEAWRRRRRNASGCG